MLTAGGHIRAGGSRSGWIVALALGLALLALAALSASIPAPAGASLTSGALSQLAAPFNCIGEKTVSSEGNACGSLVEEGTHNVFQVALSPDGRNLYSVAIEGAVIEYSRNPANGELKTIGCLTAGTETCAGEHVVENVPDIGRPSALAVSPDGKDVYVTGTEKHAVVELERNEETGLLTPMNGGKACVSEEAGGECEVKSAKGLNEPYGVTVSPGGENVYVTAVKGEAVAQFARTFPEGGPPGVLAAIAGAECIGGPGSGCPIDTVKGMFEPIGILVSPDGNNVYVAAGAGNSEGAVVAFAREGGGALQQLPGTEGCVSEKIAGCAPAISLQGSEDLVISADGANVYAASGPKNALVELKRNSETGALTQLGGSEDKCVTTGTIVGCKTVKSVGLTRGVAISPRGEDVYVGSAAENGVAAFSRGAEGALTPLTGGAECVTSEASGCGTSKLLGLGEARRVAISPDGTNLYVAGQKAGAIVELARTFTPTVTSVNLTDGAPAGKETVRIKGFGFSEDAKGVKVKFEGVEAVATVSSGTTILAETPAHAEAFVHVTVENEAGTSTESPNDIFSYDAGPRVIGVTPAIGDEAGGASVTIAGERFAEVKAVRFGSTPAASFKVESPETIVATAPPGVGMLGVTVETEHHGTSPGGVADHFSYVDGTPTPAPNPGLVLQGYCEGLGYKSVVLQREAVGGNGFAYENWACVTAAGAEVTIANSGAGPSMEEACADENPGNTVYAYPSEVNSAYAWGCDAVTPPGKEKGSEGGGEFKPPVVHLASELIASITPVPAPKLAKTGNVAPVEGSVLVELPGSKTFVALSTLTQIPFGTTIEATHGTVSVTAAEPGGKTETGVYFGGQFKLTQEKNGTVVATLTGGNFSVCPTARERAHKASAPARTAASGKHSVRKLWTNAHGKFSTKGNYAAGAVQGTEWLTDDLCEGTLIRVTRDKVLVTNLVNHKRVEVKTGHHYLAKAP